MLTETTADVVAMEEVRLKENVNPVGGGLWGPSRRERKLGLHTGLPEPRSRDRAGVLAPNPRLGNSGGGGVDALEWLKDRVARNKLASESHPEHDSLSRRHKPKGALGKHSPGLSAKELGGMVVGRGNSLVVSHPSPGHSTVSILHSRNLMDRPERPTKKQPFSNGVQAGVKSPWAANRGVIEIYRDDSMDLEDQRDLSRRGSTVKPAEIKSGDAASLLASGLAGAEIEEQWKVSLNSPTKAAASKFEQQHDQACLEKLSPQPSSEREGSNSFWSGSNVQGTPYQQTLQHYGNSVVGLPERRNVDQHFSSSGQAIGWNVMKSENAGSLVVSHDRREVRVAVVQTRSQGAASWLDVGSGLSIRSEMEERCRVSLISPSHPGASKFEHQHDGVCAKQLSPQASPHGVSSSGLLRGSKVQGTPYRQVSHQSRHSVADGPERSSMDPHLSSSGQATGLDLIKLENGRSSVTSHDRREVSRRVVKVEAVERKSPGAAAGTGTTKLEELKLRIQQQTDLKSLYPRKLASHVGSSRSGSGDDQYSFYTYTPPMPAKAEVGSSPDVEISQSKGKNSEKLVIEDENDGADFRVDLPHGTPQPHLRIGEQHHEVGHKIGSGSRASPCEQKISECVGGYSEDRANMAVPPRGISPPPPKARSAMTVTAAPGSSMWSRSSVMPRSQGEDRDSPPAHVSQDDGTKWNSTSNMYTVGPDSALLSSEVTGASSSGSSATPSVIGNSSLDDITMKSRNSVLPTPSVEKAQSSYKLSDVHQLRRTKKPPRSLGPPLRVLRDDADSCNSRISPVCVTAPVIESGALSAGTAEKEIDRNGGQLEHPRSELRKRKAERDPSGGNGDTLQILEHGTSPPASALEKGTEVEAVQAQRQQPARGSREMGSMPREHPSQKISKEHTGEAVDMSCDGFSSEENKENVLIPVVPNLSNYLSSLSLGKEDMLKKDKSKVLSNTSTSPIPSVALSSQLTTLKSVEDCRVAPSTSHPASSEISIEKRSCDQESISPCLSGSLQRNESAKRTVPSNRARDSGVGAQQSAHGSGKENGQGAIATAEKQKFENSHYVWVANKRYQKLKKIGKGGSSEVFKVIDSDCTIYALKKINLKGVEHRSALGYYQEIEYLKRFLGKRNVIQLIDYVVTDRTVVREDYEEEKILQDAYIYMVLEFGEIDLACMLSKKRKDMMESNEVLDEDWLRFYWKQMLLAVQTIHDERIVHADLKPANFLLVKGELKLIDFGIAKTIQSDTTHIVRDSLVGTFNYMSPEAFMANTMDDEGRMVKCGRASDIWSLGCILYQMVYGHTPFSKVDSFHAKIQAITSKNHKIEFPAIPDPWLQDVMKKCLTWDRYRRPQITDLLQHPFLHPGLASQEKVPV